MKKFILLAAIILVGCGSNDEPVKVYEPVVINIDISTGMSYNEVECLAQNIYFEARGEPFEGQIAVAHVVLNRQKDTRYPSTLCDVIREGPISSWFLEEQQRIVPLRDQCQFSWWCDGLSDEPKDLEAWGRAMYIASGVIAGKYEDPTNGAIWYHSNTISPNWNFVTRTTAKIENHVFYR